MHFQVKMASPISVPAGTITPLHFDVIFARFLRAELLNQNACEEARGPLGCVLMGGGRAREDARARVRGRCAVSPAHTHTPPPHTHTADACRSPACVREAAAAAACSDPPRPASQKAAGAPRARAPPRAPAGARERGACPATPRYALPSGARGVRALGGRDGAEMFAARRQRRR